MEHVAAVTSDDPHDLARRGEARLRAGDAVVPALGMTVEAVAPGTATARLTVTPAMLNGHDTTHGGYVFLLADTAFAFACNTRSVAVAASCDVDFLEPTTAGDELVALATERVVRGRSGVYDVTVSRDGVTVAEFRGRSRSIAPQPPTSQPPTSQPPTSPPPTSPRVTSEEPS